MDRERRQAESLPYYYNDDLGGGLSLMPFLVAPLGEFQASILLGPQSVAELHNQFINDLYSQSHNIDVVKGMIARAFMFHSRLCLAITLPTEQTDKGGREGLSLTFGVLVNKGVIVKYHFALSAYIKVFIDNLNRVFSLSLPAEGADKFLSLIHLAHEQRDFFDVYTQFLSVLDMLILASRTVEDLCVSIPKTRSLLHRLRRWISRWKVPKVIMYPPDSDYEEILSIFFREFNRKISKLGQTGIQVLLSPTSDKVGIISLIPAPPVISNARKIKYGKHRGKVYLRIY